MNQRLSAGLVSVVLGAAVFPPAVAEGRPASEPKAGTDAEFVELVLKAATMLHADYVVEIPRADLIEWTVRGLYYRVNAHMPPDLEDRLGKANSMNGEELRGLLLDVRRNLGIQRELSADRYLDLALEEMTRRLDNDTLVLYPDSTIYDPLWIAGGVGMRLTSDTSTGLPQVVTPFLGGPAYKAGIRAGDLITQVKLPEERGGEPLQEPLVFSTKGESLTHVLNHITGKEGTRVRLTVQRPGVDTLTEYALVRARMEEETVLGYRRQADDRWDYWVDADTRLAYVRLAEFKRETAKELGRVLAALQKEKPKGMVLDLRFNPGGYLDSAIDVSDLFIDDGRIVTARQRGAREHAFYGRHEGSYLDVPMVCLVNGETGRSSEILAACLQDHKRAVLMGERTKGNCAHQNIVPFGSHPEFQFTNVLFFRPSGKNLYRMHVLLPRAEEDEWGVTPEREYLLRLPAVERKVLAQQLERQTFIFPPERYAKETGRKANDRQLEMAVAYLRSHGENP
jgi:carboxyl-terminal processing protease